MMSDTSFVTAMEKKKAAEYEKLHETARRYGSGKQSAVGIGQDAAAAKAGNNRHQAEQRRQQRRVDAPDQLLRRNGNGNRRR